MEAPQDKCIQVLLVTGFQKIRFSKHCMRCTTVRDVLSSYYTCMWTFYGRPSQKQNLSLSNCSVSFPAEIKHADDFSITVARRETTLKVKSIFIAHSRKQHPADVSNTSGHSRRGLARGHNKRRGAVELKCPGGLLRLPSHGWE